MTSPQCIFCRLMTRTEKLYGHATSTSVSPDPPLSLPPTPNPNTNRHHTHRTTHTPPPHHHHHLNHHATMGHPATQPLFALVVPPTLPYSIIAVLGAIESAYAIANGVAPVPLSPEQITDCNKMFVGNGGAVREAQIRDGSKDGSITSPSFEFPDPQMMQVLYGWIAHGTYGVLDGAAHRTDGQPPPSNPLCSVKDYPGEPPTPHRPSMLCCTVPGPHSPTHHSPPIAKLLPDPPPTTNH